MADETPLDLDKIGEITDPDELRKLEEQIRQGPAATTEAATGETPEIGERPAEGDLTPPPAEAKPAEPAPKVEEPPALPQQDNAAWKRVRLLEKQLADMQRAKETPPAEAPKGPPAFDDDPAIHLKNKTDNLEAELQRLKTQQAQQQFLEGLKDQESQFERATPDYRKAVDYLETFEERDWKVSGLANAQVRQLREAVDLGKRGDPRGKHAADWVADVAQRPEIIAEAQRTNADPEDVALYRTARDSYVQSRREIIWAGAKADGVSIAQRAYEVAIARGYTPAQAAAAAQQAQPDNGEASRQKVLQQKQISEATNSLSESRSGETGAQPRVLRNRSEVVQLDDAALDALIAEGQYRNL